MQKLSLQQKLLQKLSPQQIQIIKLLEIPTVELEQRIKKELEENPILDASDSISAEERDKVDQLMSKKIDEINSGDGTPSYRYESNNSSKDDKVIDIPISEGSSFLEVLKDQVALTEFSSDREQALAEYIIGNIDDDGYLRRDIESIADDLAFSTNLEVADSELELVLEKIQKFEPAGVGARDLREALLIQLQRKLSLDSRPDLVNAYKIVDLAFDPFTKKHYDKVGQVVSLKDDELKRAVHEIIRLNPKPGGSIGVSLLSGGQPIIPDFIVENENGEISLNLNQRGVPELRLNGIYSSMLDELRETKKRTKSQKETLNFVRHKMDSAKWFIEAIRQRQQTLLLVMGEILNFQYSYFLDGDKAKLKPMVLRDIAERTEMDISTISRVTSNKYVQTHFGIFSLKSLFTEGFINESGDEISTAEIKSVLKEYIDKENKRKPLTDDKLSEILKEHSYGIARRTVAKYREQLGIPVARLRKEL